MGEQEGKISRNTIPGGTNDKCESFQAGTYLASFWNSKVVSVGSGEEGGIRQVPNHVVPCRP